MSLRDNEIKCQLQNFPDVLIKLIFEYDYFIQGIIEREFNKFYGYQSGINHLLLLSDGRVASASRDGNIGIWNFETNICELTIPGRCSKLIELPDTRLIATNSNILHIWNLKTGTSELRLDTYALKQYNLLNDGRLITISENSKIKIWNLTDGSHINIISHNNGIDYMCIISDDFIAFSSDISIFFYNLKTHNIVKTFTPYYGMGKFISTKSKVIFGVQGTITIIDLESNYTKQELIIEEDKSITNLQVLSNGKIIFKMKNKIGLLDLNTNEKTIFDDHCDYICFIHELPDSRITTYSRSICLIRDYENHHTQLIKHLNYEENRECVSCILNYKNKLIFGMDCGSIIIVK